MKVKVTHKFKDKYTGKTHIKGEVLEITPERYQEIRAVGDFVFQIAQNDTSATESPDAINTSGEKTETAETPADASSDAFDEMSIRELKEYADKAYKLAFKNGMKKAEIIEELRRRENHG